MAWSNGITGAFLWVLWVWLHQRKEENQLVPWHKSLACSFFWTILPYSYSHGITLDSVIVPQRSQGTIWTLNCCPTWMSVSVQPKRFYSFLLRSTMLSCLSLFIPGSVGDLFCSQFSHLFLSNSVLDRLVQIFNEETVCHCRG